MDKDALEGLYYCCKEFVEANQITCEEMIYQTDKVLLDAQDFIANVCDFVGYYPLDSR